MAHEIISNAGDSLDEDAIRALLGRESVSGYVASGGVGVTYHSADDTIDISPGRVYLLHNGHDITIETDAWAGYSLEANAVNNVWIEVDGSAASDDDAVQLFHNTTGAPPARPAIQIAEVDTNLSGSAAVELLNRGTAPALEGEDINPRSVGQGQAALDIAAESMAATTGTIDSLTATSADIDTADVGTATADTVTSTDDNGVRITRSDADIQAAIDSVTGNRPDLSGIVRVDPSLHSTWIQDGGASFPITVKEGVTLDLRGARLQPPSVPAVFDLRNFSTVLTSGSVIRCNFMSTGDILFHWNGNNGYQATDEAAQVLGFGQILNCPGPVVTFRGDGGGAVAGALAQLRAKNVGTVAHFNNAGSSGGFVNDNHVTVRGSVQPNNGPTGSVFQFDGSRENTVFFNQLQAKGDETTDCVVTNDSSNHNYLYGTIADPNYFRDILRCTSSSGGNNTVALTSGYLYSSRTENPESQLTDNSPFRTNSIRPLDHEQAVSARLNAQKPDMPSGTKTLLNLTGSDYDNSGRSSYGVQPSTDEYFAPRRGIYHVDMSVHYAAAGVDNWFRAFADVNGQEHPPTGGNPGAPGQGGCYATLSKKMRLDVGDSVKFFGFQDTGNPVTVGSQTEIDIAWIGRGWSNL